MKTLAEWNDRGRLVKKGSKAKGFNFYGKALFSKKQTEEGFEEYQDNEVDYDIIDGDYDELDYDGGRM